VTTETDLVERCQAGDQDAFRCIVETYHDRVFRVGYALTSDPDAAAEVVQETFLKAWRALPRFRGEASLATWLTRLALNAGRDHLRRERSRGLLVPLLAAVGVLQRDAVGRVADRDELDRALRRLTPKEREVIGMHYGVDLSLAEIARTLGCPEGTVKSRLNAALTRMRRSRSGVSDSLATGGG
jgi:RNA polymerase sigma-70 factor, ECF subfamily